MTKTNNKDTNFKDFHDKLNDLMKSGASREEVQKLLDKEAGGAIAILAKQLGVPSEKYKEFTDFVRTIVISTQQKILEMTIRNITELKIELAEYYKNEGVIAKKAGEVEESVDSVTLQLIEIANGIVDRSLQIVAMAVNSGVSAAEDFWNYKD